MKVVSNPAVIILTASWKVLTWLLPSAFLLPGPMSTFWLMSGTYTEKISSVTEAKGPIVVLKPCLIEFPISAGVPG